MSPLALGVIIERVGARSRLGRGASKAIAFALILAAARTAGSATVAPAGTPQDATLENASLRLRFSPADHGVRLVSFMNRLSGHEYLHPRLDAAMTRDLPEPSLWDGWVPGKTSPPPSKLPDGFGSAESPEFGSPFYVSVRRPGKTDVFRASTDFDLLSWGVANESFTARLRGRGIFLDATLQVSLSDERSYWKLDLKNTSVEPLTATVGFPAMARVVVTGARRDRLFVPWGSGAVLRDPATLKWSGTYGAELSSPFLVWQGDGEGLYLADNNSYDLLAEPDRALRRGIRIGPGNAAPADSGPSLGFEQSVRLERGGETTLGPVVLGDYRGAPMTGAAEVAQVLRSLVRLSRPVPFLTREPAIAFHSGALPSFTDGPRAKGWNVVLLSGFSGEHLGDYATIPSQSGGADALKKAIGDLHQAGGRVLFVMDGGHVSKESAIGRANGKEWAIRSESGQPLEEDGQWILCPANAKWRDWFTQMAVRLVKTYGADGIAVTGLAGEPYRVCSSRDHKHASPYAWTWGIRRLFADLRDRLDRETPGAALIGAGVLDVTREFADALVAQTHERTGFQFDFPLFRAVYPAGRVYESAFSSDADLSARLHAWDLSQGLPVYSPPGASPDDVRSLRRLFTAYPEVYDSPFAETQIEPNAGDLATRIWVGENLVLGLGNVGDDVYSGSVRLPFRAAALLDRLTGLRVEPDAQGAYPMALVARQGALWEIVRAAPR